MAMGGAGAFPRAFDGLQGMRRIKEGHRGQAHQSPIAGRHEIGRATIGLAGSLEALQRFPHRVPDVEANTDAAPVSFPIPAEIAAELIDRVKATAFD